jgi:flagellar assembly protein FliH
MSNSPVVSGQLTAYERWELPSLGAGGGNTANARYNKNVKLPTAAQLEEIQRQAHDEGYQAGYAEGSQRMAALLNSMEQALQQTDHEIAQDLLNLSLAVAQKMVQQALKTNPEILLNTLREAIGNLPHFNQGAHLFLHPDDATMVRSGMGEQLAHTGWKIFEDTLISRGGVRVETSHSQIDATLENRWQRIVASLGQTNSWIAE